MTQLLPRRQICCLSSKTRRRNVGTQLSVFLMATEAPPLFKLHLYVLLYTSRHSHAVNFEVNSSRFIFWYRSKSPFQFSTFLLLKLLKVPSQQRSVSNSVGLRDFSWFFLIHHHRWHFALNCLFRLAKWSWPVAPRLQLELTRFVHIWFWRSPHTAQSRILT